MTAADVGVGAPSPREGFHDVARDANKRSGYFLPQVVAATRHRHDPSKRRRRKQVRILSVLCLVAVAFYQAFLVDPIQSPSNGVATYRRGLFARDADAFVPSIWRGDIGTYADGERVSVSRAAPEAEPHDAASVRRTHANFRDALMLTIFDAQTGTLQTFADERWSFNNFRGYSPSYVLSRALMRHFPERFRVGRGSFQILFTNSDVPPGTWWQQCLNKALPDHARACRDRVRGFAPILTFGSAPKDRSALPSLHQFPLTTFTSCFDQMTCSMTMPIKGPTWKDLKPQIVWRGSDFSTLHGMGFDNWRPGHFFQEVRSASASKDDMVETLLQRYDGLTPRWKAVAQSLVANLAANKEGLPWIDAKFLQNPHASSHGQLQQFVQQFKEYGLLLVTQERMGEKEMAEYKYQLDIGGGGGTTWTGTLRKLAMPGLLLHHETPTRDFFYDEIRPWVHYIPIKTDLSDLRDKYDWAESHPEAAQKISKAATDYVAKMATDDWLNQTYKKYFVDDLSRIVGQYQPTEEENIASILDEYNNSRVGSRSLKLYLTCTSDSCTWANVPYRPRDRTFSKDRRKFA